MEESCTSTLRREAHHNPSTLPRRALLPPSSYNPNPFRNKALRTLWRSNNNTLPNLVLCPQRNLLLALNTTTRGNHGMVEHRTVRTMIVAIVMPSQAIKMEDMASTSNAITSRAMMIAAPDTVYSDDVMRGGSRRGGGGRGGGRYRG